VTEAGRVRGAVNGLTLSWGVSALPDFSGFLLIMDYLLRSVVYRLLIDYPGLAISPGYRLVLGFLVIFLESNLLCSFVFQFAHFMLPYFFCLFCILFYY